MIKFAAISGIITAVEGLHTSAKDKNAGCYLNLTVLRDGGEIINFIIKPTTYFVDFITVKEGDSITGFYDALAPAPLIYPPRYNAVVISENIPGRSVKADYFNGFLVSRDGMLKLNITSDIQVLLTNNQTFMSNPAGRNLIAIYRASTRSIPAQTNPDKVIVLCE